MPLVLEFGAVSHSVKHLGFQGLFGMLYTLGRSALCNNFPKKTVFVAITFLYNQVHRAWKHFVIVLKQQKLPWGTTQGTGINWLPPLSDL